MLIRTKENTFTAKFKTGGEATFIKGTKLNEILEYDRPHGKEATVLVKVNNHIHDLWWDQKENCTIEWMPIQSVEAMRSYQQTLCWIFIKAVKDLYPSQKLLIDHSLGKGLYCEWKGSKTISQRKVKMIQKQMLQLIRENITLKPVNVLKNKAIQHLNNRAECLDTYINGKTGSEIRLYTMGDSLIHLGYPLLPSTGYIDVFDLLPWKHGLILRFPDIWGSRTLPVFIEQKKLFHVFHEFGKWEQILEIQKISSLNQMIENNTVSELIKICEGLHEKKISIIADQVEQKLKNRRLILIAGPSSSGKTTFTKRLFIQLRVNELRPVIISLDDYFLNKAQTPKDKDGQPNFESPQAIDTIQLNGDLLNLLDGKTVRIPNYDFKTGKRIPGEEYTLEKHQPILIEGIHALNDLLTPSFPQKMKFKIYISALTQLNITDLLRIHTSDIRLLRRLIRDEQFRSHSPIHTLENWLNVRQGEETHIFPFQEEAATIFNTALPYELAVLKTFAQPLLEKIPQKEPAFTEGQRLLDLLLHVDPISPNEVPSNSILREFIGHSSFDY